MRTEFRRAAVVGSPVAHSLSPVLHLAAFEALGLSGWTYERIERDAEGLPSLVASLDESWVGLSVTMPGKQAALRVADTATDRAQAVGAANTLVRNDSGWHADCTDVDGVIGALLAGGYRPAGTSRNHGSNPDNVGTPPPGVTPGADGAYRGQPGAPGAGAGSGAVADSAGGVAAGGGAGCGQPGASAIVAGSGAVAGLAGVVLGAGGTACAALAGLVSLGVRSVSVVVREPSRAGAAVACAGRLGLPATVVTWAAADFAALAKEAAVLVSTVPAAAIEPCVDALAGAPCVLDVIYHPWPTALATAVERRGGVLVTGLDMLLHQAFTQVELFTGRPAPREAMRDALRAATGNTLELPICG